MQVSFTMISPKGQTFAPIEIDHSLVDALVSDAKPSFKLAEIEKSPDPSAKFLMNYEDVARARIRRQGGWMQSGWCLACLNCTRNVSYIRVKTKEKVGIPMDYLKWWIGEERLPDGWKLGHTLGLLDVKYLHGLETPWTRWRRSNKVQEILKISRPLKY